ncbi:xanthine dehydrogenase/oxidase-like [Antedon mediterranea]|uniref:xanthine dehydrogenase/oxidase-like n=1 Tax=Antedon mediterranea TaxID=105859 RepID=UPI003AF530CF
MSKKEETEFIFFCNGRKIVDLNIDPSMTLLSYLRRKLGLTGSKLGCGEGGCGACTVMVSSYNKLTTNITHVAVNACLTTVCQVYLTSVTTVEGIGSIEDGLHPVQERIAKAHGSQCGFCTSGIVMSMYTLLRNNDQPCMPDIEDAFQGNLCRCTGYRPILEGYRTFTKISTTLFQPSEFTSYDSTKDIMFPQELILMIENEKPMPVRFTCNDATWLRPVNLQQMLDMRKRFPDAKIVAGNTEVGVEIQQRKMIYPVTVSVAHVTELNIIELYDEGVRIGASVTLSRIDTFLRDTIKKTPDYKCKSLVAIVDMLHWFAGQQIRNVAAVGGNIITGSPISDLNPIFMAAGSTLEFADTDGVRRMVSIKNDFFTGYRKNSMKENETLISITVPFTKQTEYFKAFKQAHRRDDDIAIVNAAFRVDFDENTIRDCTLAFGGMAPTTKLAEETMKLMIGRVWDQALFNDVTAHLANEMSISPGAPGGMVEYRQSLVISFFFKFYVFVRMDNTTKTSSKEESSASIPLKRGIVESTQMFQEVSDDRSPIDLVGRPVVHLSAYQQATGEAVFVDDIVPFQNELFMAIVFSQKAHAIIKSVDATAALAIRGVHVYVDHNDVPGNNFIGNPVKDEELFATSNVTSIGQYIGGIVAEDRDIAQRAAKLVKVEYQELEPIISIEDAIAKNSSIEPTRILTKGSVLDGFKYSDQVVEGEIKVGEQEHFYMETQSCIAIPTIEDDVMDIITSSQTLKSVQAAVADVIGVQYHKVRTRAKRVGGAFGGKETGNIPPAAAAAVAAKSCKRPVRCVLDRNDDMASTGTRHAFLARYKVGFTNDGKIQALKIDMYMNCGHSQDLSLSVMERAMFHVQNVYYIPNVEAHGYCCKTNISSNTAFRGFGSPQSTLAVENWISDIALACGISQNKVREINMLQVGQSTYFNQKVEDLQLLKRCWEECLDNSEYKHRQSQVEEYNRSKRWQKRGIAALPIMYGVGYSNRFLNQAGALVIIYTDGSVLLTHGGVEMGQGLYTKMVQVASRTLGIPASRIHTNETSTATVPNTSPTSASVGSDLNGMAVKIACEKLCKRLEPYKKQEPNKTWNEWVKAAYFDRVNLSATGFYKTPDIGFDWQTKSGNPSYYFTYGVAVSEVEIDCLTGDHVVLRTDIVMDVGDSINPAIDIGQIEGAFVQGYGLYTLEEHRWSPTGQLLTKGPGFYKLPSFTDIPVTFNVSLLDGVPHEKVVCSSKAIGEPPLLLAGSVFFAIKDAIRAARRDAGKEEIFRLDSPATAERIRMACADSITEKFPPASPGTFTPFFIRS